jgi:hypothetical protein
MRRIQRRKLPSADTSRPRPTDQTALPLFWRFVNPKLGGTVAMPLGVGFSSLVHRPGCHEPSATSQVAAAAAENAAAVIMELPQESDKGSPHLLHRHARCRQRLLDLLGNYGECTTIDDSQNFLAVVDDYEVLEDRRSTRCGDEHG